MLTVRDKALTVHIDTFTGNTTIRYVFPVKKQFIQDFQDVAQVYSINIDTCKNTTRAIYTITAPSNVAFESFRAVQKQLMLLSRECKIKELSAQIERIKA